MTEPNWDQPDDLKYPERYGSFGKIYNTATSRSASSEAFMEAREEFEKHGSNPEYGGPVVDPNSIYTSGMERPEDFIPFQSKESFPSGAVRDTQEGKPRYDLIPPKGLRRLADALTEGDKNYGTYNWHKGMPVGRSVASLMRHVEGIRMKDDSEDHVAKAMCNLMFIAEFQDTELDDRYEW